MWSWGQIAGSAGVSWDNCKALAPALGSAAPCAGPGTRTLEAVAAAWQPLRAVNYQAAAAGLADHSPSQAADTRPRRGASEPGAPLQLLGSPQWSGSSADHVSSCFG